MTDEGKVQMIELEPATPPVPAGEPPAADSALSSLVNRVAAATTRELSLGDVAELRRLTPEEPWCPAFWKLTATYLQDALPGDGPARDEAERRWAAILAGMAVTRGLHQPGRHAGAALAEAGYSELRLDRLLRARGAQLPAVLRGAATFLASKAVLFDWRDLVRLVLSEGRSDEEAVRRRIARSYYQQLTKAS